MGESKNNQRSSQYTGPLPDMALGTQERIQVMPSVKWVSEGHPASEEPPESERDVVILRTVEVVIPSRFVPQAQWSNCSLGLVEVLRVPMLEIRRRAAEVFEKSGQTLAAETVLAGGRQGMD